MLLYIVRRILATIPVMGVVALVVFLLLHLAPGDPAVIIAGDNATQADVLRVRANLGLDKPLHVQFVVWIGRLVRGDLGVSVFSNVPVTHLILERLEPTFALALCTFAVTVLVAIPLGLVAANLAGSWVDRLVMAFTVLGFSVPLFVVAYLLVFGISIRLGILPVQGYASIRGGIGPFVRHMALPTFALALAYMALVARMARASVLEVLNQDYIRTARAKGLATQRVLLRHALRNAAVPIVTIVGVGVALLISGAVVTETVFALPGLGRLTVEAILRRDYPIIQGVTLLFSGAYVMVTLGSTLYTLCSIQEFGSR